MKSFDATDRAILQALQRDARQTTAELAEQVSLSQSPCWRRVRQLEDAGVIEGYHARLSRRHLGYGVTGFIQLQMQDHTAEVAAAFEREVVALPQVVACHNLSGQYDYLIEAIATDLDAFSTLVRNKIRCLPGVREISTSFSLKEVKGAGGLPVVG
ncbi:Lrp/AsnC family transcriptional regulator [Curvibacter sp. APW13]|uniref:Lrp/AsnC family transcriptional regulator n=1 Tax=Curvibacter sp. APW13 TaxID=3077236 RepID=UPI0028DE3E8D|nr:Lrp/AsnC family transcriptional regulator [Curvibacter sp. APW13]MDT8989975.1 Lrp/AsnC family transcriptional regulator [Curvibacter sp. APW13]